MEFRELRPALVFSLCGCSDPLSGSHARSPTLSFSPSPRPFTRDPAGWHFTLYPDAREGGGSFQSATRRVAAFVASGSARDPERAAEEAARRARAKLRRYCAANGLSRLGTLTYSGDGCHEPALVRAHLAQFFKSLRSQLGGKAFPYVWVPEWHKLGHGLHAHFAVGRYVPQPMIKATWGRGGVDIRMINDLPVGSGAVTQARVAARYLSKYVTKTFNDPEARVLGLHRYDVAQGFQPKSLSLLGRSARDVLDQASEILKGPTTSEWFSSSVDEWSLPPAVSAQWGR